MNRIRTTIFFFLCLLFTQAAMAQPLSQRYNSQRPLIVVCDWEKPPYEFRNNDGQPAGTNVDLLKAITKELDIPCEFVMKEWTTAIKTFERGEADIILANVKRYRNSRYFCSQNIINYNRICIATAGDSARLVRRNELLEKGVVLKYGDFVGSFLYDKDSLLLSAVEFQSPKAALLGLLDGDYKYFVWGEEPLKWKIKELNLEGVTINDSDLPVSEIHIIGRDSVLIESMDDYYSRLKQSGEVQRIIDHWLHPEREKAPASAWFVYVVLTIVLLVIIYGFNRMARSHVKNATRKSSDLNNMMYKALHMGDMHVMEYDIKRDRMTNRYGLPMLPKQGITLNEFTSHIHPNEREEFRQKMQQLMTGRERKFELKKRWQPFDGTSSWVILDGHAIVELDHHGRPAYIINAVSDVTKSMEEDRAARELVQKYEKLSQMPFMAISFYDKGGWLISLNDSMRTLCGITADNPDSERYWYSLCIFDVPMFRNTYLPGARHDLLACMHMYYPEIDANSYIEYHIAPLYNRNGEVANYYCSILDVTQEHDRHLRMRMLEQQIKEIKQRIDRYEHWLNFLTKQGDTYLWYSDIASRTAYYYHSLEGEAPFDFITMPFEMQLSNMPESERAEAEACLTNQDPLQEPFENLHHFNNTVLEGGESWFRISGTPIFDGQGRVVGHRGKSLDVTREMAAKKQLQTEMTLAENSVKLKSGFMASMTHELRTPLNAIIGFTDILEAVDTAEERNEYIRIIRNNCDMMQRLISDILTASSLSDELSSVEQVDVDFAKAFEDICLTLQQRVPEHVKFLKDNPYHSFYTTLDIGRVNQIITNFVTNAVKFTHHGHIRLSYRYDGHGLRIICEDTGVGIPLDKQGIIFDRFVKLDEFVQGTGMGLNICKNIAQRLGGSIGVESEGKDKGSIFWVWIPCTRKQLPTDQ